jgi:hypothetical protein
VENQTFIEKLQDRTREIKEDRRNESETKGDDNPDHEEYNCGQNLDYDSKNDYEPNDRYDDEGITYKGDISKEN